MTKADFDAGLDKARASFSQSIGAPSIPNVSWDDVGGLSSVKDDILDTIQLPLDHPELFADGLKQRSGMNTCTAKTHDVILVLFLRYSVIRSSGDWQNSPG